MNHFDLREDLPELYCALLKSASRTEQMFLRRLKALRETGPYRDYPQAAGPLAEAMEYSLAAGGKRLRPFLVYALCELSGGNEAAADCLACAVEMVHTFSLIHDDLPCMDDDDMRRGKPSSHIQFGQACALLAGDALLADAFGVLCDSPLTAEQIRAAVMVLSHAAGSCGMTLGQQIDLYAEARQVSPDLLRLLQQKKTGAMFIGACELGCIAAGKQKGTKEYGLAEQYASHIGLAFQMTDDILDVTGDTKTLGKRTGRDAKEQKTTYVSLFTVQGARKLAQEQVELAKQAIGAFPAEETSLSPLLQLADYILLRDH